MKKSDWFWLVPVTIAMLSLLVQMVACATTNNSDDDDDDDGDDDDDDDLTGQEATIYDLQQGNVDDGTRVLIKQVVVTSGLTDEGDGFFIQEQDGGPYSGIYVFVTGEASGEINPVVGDLINIAGEYSEYYELSELAISAVGDYEVLDSVSPPDPEELDPDDLATDADDAEQWEGVLVRVKDVEVTDAELGYNEFEVTGGARVDDMFFNPDSYSPPPQGTTFDSITGPFTYTFENYKICPRDGDDFDGDWEPPASGDDDDNTGEEATIYDVQQGEYSEGSTVTVTGVIVSPPDFKGDTIFIMDPAGGEYSGIAVYMWSEVVDVYEGEMGDEVRVTGEISEFFDLTELVIKDPGDLEITGEGDMPDPERIDTDEAGEEWESVLVEVEDVEVTADPNDYGEFEINDELPVDDMFFEKDHWSDYGISTGDEFSSIVGILTYNYEEWKLEPREDADLAE